ncbi:Icc-related predicted phosphoesterase [Methanohalophilus levihalophilus]|uniref:metallophosphoesterase family protein n=1 Tax=Methanohalophilus levihalophilus TaxID=1431282 RepID=UPI001AE740FB|nr:metallophosphoesterase [Methanohalophilus levihalophilus]MBP2029532.1 Icc-related predicted phosphoesterase [Methanohalophilus levihalophilus]
MRILAISDTHGKFNRIPDILEKAGDIDLVLVAGDITNFGPDEKAVELLDMFEVPVFAVPGNCDLRTIVETIEKSNATNLHKRMQVFRDVTFIGMGGSNPTPFNTPFEIEESEIASSLEKLVSDAKANGGYIVLLSHSPPFCTLDRVESGNVGCKSTAKLLGRVDLIVSGHIHEDGGIMEEQGTTIVNTGMASQGSAALIELDADSHKVDVKMIQV